MAEVRIPQQGKAGRGGRIVKFESKSRPGHVLDGLSGTEIGRLPIWVRLLAQVELMDNGCWLWTGVLDRQGYGRMKIHQRTRFVHRVSYETFVRPIPAGKQLDHLCRTPRCFKPDHLEPVTQQENILRGVSVVAQNARKTHCPQGHPYNEENTRRYGKGQARYCLTCHHEHQRETQARKAAENDR